MSKQFDSSVFDWVTFKRPVWVGLEHNYTDSISLRANGPDRPDRPRCASFERTDKEWRFVMGDQTAVIVPNTNISFVVLGAREDIAAKSEPDNQTVVGSETAADRHDGQDQIEEVHDDALSDDGDSSDHPGENISHGIDTPAPKRRGRPPKYPRPL